MRINPAILVTKQSDLLLQASNLVDFVTELDIDIIDWTRTDTRTLTAHEALQNKIPLKLIFDLMMDHPKETVRELIYDNRVKTIILNTLCKDNIEELIDLIHFYKKNAGMSINPDDELDKVMPYLHDLDLIEIFTIEPGAQGMPFLPARLDLAPNLKLLGFKGQIEIDGGVNLDTIDTVRQYPIDILSVGSYLSRSKNPGKAYLLLKKAAESGYLQPVSGSGGNLNPKKDRVAFP
jgi:pentose-5-phosphate-3-epimerase